MPPEHEQAKIPDLKVRSWGACGRYGINPISEAGRQWAENWLLQQSFVTGTTHDGAITYPDDNHETVRCSARGHGLTAIAGTGPDPADGSPYWRD